MYHSPVCGSNGLSPVVTQSAACSLANCGYSLTGRMLDVTRCVPVSKPANEWFPALSGPFSVAFQPSSGEVRPVTGLMLPSSFWPAAVRSHVRAQVVLGEVVRERLALAIVGGQEVAVALLERIALLRVLDAVVLAARVHALERHAAALVHEVTHRDDRAVRLQLRHARHLVVAGELSLPVYQMTAS